MEHDFILNESELEKINRFTRRTVTAEEVYAFPVVLCDNDIDRDGDRFSTAALGKLAELFVGKTGIFDHDPKGENQTARIYECSVRTDDSRTALTGEPYTYLYARAYMMRTERSRDLITEIEGGIKKEVSVSCSVGRRSCSICGSDRTEDPCGHIKGRRYEGRLCHDVLDDPGDAYEWSFVAVPAQPAAGVTKRFSEHTTRSEDIAKLTDMLSHERELTERACEMLRREIISLSFMTRPIMTVEAVKALTEKLGFSELEALRDTLAKQAADSEPDDSADLFRSPKKKPSNTSFKL